MKIKIRKAFDRDRSELKFHNDEGELLEPCIVEQHHSDDTVIQNILKRYDKTGVFYHVNQAQASYQDNTAFNEYADMYNKIKTADENFAALPAEIRAKFNNDTGAFLEFVNNDSNIEAMEEMGLIPKSVDQNAEEVYKKEESQAVEPQTETQE